MRLIIVVDKLKGGAGNIAQILALYYYVKDYEVFLLLNDIETESRYDLSGIKIIKRKTSHRKLGMLSDIISSNKLVKEIMPDIIISLMYINNVEILLAEWFTGIPIIVSERTNPYQLPKTLVKKLARNIAYRRANVVTVQFDYFKQAFKNRRIRNKIAVTPNVVLKPKYQNSELGNKPNHVISFITLASSNPCKRIDLMIRLFSEIHNNCPNTELKIYGITQVNKELNSLITELKLEQHISIFGPTKKIYEALYNSDIYLMTSAREGFPNALSESMAVGLPSVSFRCHDGLSELITNGYNGFLIEEGNHNEYCQTAIKLVNDKDLRDRIGSAGLLSVEKYSYNQIMVIWDDLIEGLLSRPG